MCACAWVCVVNRGQRKTVGVFLYCSSRIPLVSHPSWSLPFCLTCLVRKLPGSTCPFVTDMHGCVQFLSLAWILEIWFRSSCLYRKYSTYWAISPGPKVGVFISMLCMRFTDNEVSCKDLFIYCVFGVCMHACVCGGPRSTLVSLSIVFHLSFWNMFFSVILGLTDAFWLTGSRPQGSSCAWPISSGITEFCCHIWVFMWVTGIWTQVFVLQYKYGL